MSAHTSKSARSNPDPQISPALSPETSPEISHDPLAEIGDSERMWDIGYAPNLTDLQLHAIALTIQGHRDTQTARILSINRRTLWQWKTFDDEYRAALARADHLCL